MARRRRSRSCGTCTVVLGPRDRLRNSIVPSAMLLLQTSSLTVSYRRSKSDASCFRYLSALRDTHRRAGGGPRGRGTVSSMIGSAALGRVRNGETRTIVLLRLVHPGSAEVDDLDLTDLPLDETFIVVPHLPARAECFAVSPQRVVLVHVESTHSLITQLVQDT